MQNLDYLKYKIYTSFNNRMNIKIIQGNKQRNRENAQRYEGKVMTLYLTILPTSKASLLVTHALSPCFTSLEF